MATLTLVVCTLNASKHLPGCLAAIREQKVAGVALVIIDGGSTDETLSVIERNTDIIDNWKSQPDDGVYDAMNSAIGLVQSEWVLFLGADDRVMPGILPRLIPLLGKFDPKTTVLYGDVYRPASNAIYDGEFTKYKILRRNICQQAILYPTIKLKEEGFDTRFKINADHIRNIRLFFEKRTSMHYIPVCIAYYEDVATGISRNRGDAEILSERRRIAKELGGPAALLFCWAVDLKQTIRQTSHRLLRQIHKKMRPS